MSDVAHALLRLTKEPMNGVVKSCADLLWRGALGVTVLTGCVIVCHGCYRSHGISPADGGFDAETGFDAPEPPADLDARDTPNRVDVPDGAVTLPCEAVHTQPIPSGEPRTPCERPGSSDFDVDGFSNDVDCDDCNPLINRGAYDFPNNGIDEDCSGVDASPCDESGLDLASTDPNDALRAMGLCERTASSSRRWGILSSEYTSADGRGPIPQPIQFGILTGLGESPFPVGGESMLGLSSGIAREPEDRGDSFCADHQTVGGFPPGFPVDSPACPGVGTGPVHDSVALEVRLVVPTNVHGFRFASSFFTHEYPDYICSPYNDVFAVLQERSGELVNIVFDAAGNPVTVNNALLAACRYGTHGGVYFECPLGYWPLVSTGYDVGCGLGPISREGSGASTGCIRTVSSVEPGSTVTLRFTIWDSGDGLLDSLAVVDDFQWIPIDYD